ncbi:hypothetical protein AN4113.2 [Aspergillus nidulans FGSC A4]|uniref:histidine kinase n=1 Tax=Emericella nidulans (strain FGSC A4 / ATCC 38163 / CBS 112.46 / NRRL 194 / M139) TaxID=227321 RepID=Q5B5R7_EMENI|nr:protein hk-8-2 [Aspergillus nidulans FGSC A4]EAA59374.1 hypothetical protein AN4113.2 [Aspergillus nidulans FGSC A4]CBF74681.1 TPA: conserved hypothetical protein [Aspergillus nidulans FGSC A4]|eukprot:XP_661717.1 hypothetical protein AN4113.2 [Aspergillus nidulans FGSC A4]
MDPDSYPFNLAKEREFYSSYPFAPFDDSSRKTFSPASSQDHALTSFAQLGAMRLGAQRAIISLFGPTNQYILAEATGSPDDELRLGCCVLPKENSICTELTTTPSNLPDNTTVSHGALIIPDLQGENKERYAVPKQLYAARFYAGVPIISPRGQVIGSYGVLDSQPRPSGVDESTINFMKDMAATIMRYLDMMHLEHENIQARKMITGLGSFVEGKSTLRDSWLESNEQDAARGRHGDETIEGLLDKRQQDLQEARDNTRKQPPHRPARKDSSPGADDDETDARPGTHKRQNSHLQRRAICRSEPSGDSLPDDDGIQGSLQEIFSRAANLIRESIAVEGVVFFDARVESFGGLVGYEYCEDHEARSESETTTSSEESPDTGLENGTTICRILGSSTSVFSTINEDSRARSNSQDNGYALREFLLKAMMNRYPRGKIFNYNNDGSLSDESGSNFSADTSKSVSTKDSRRRKRSHKQDANDLHRVLHGPRSIIFLPLWDSHKSRWLSGLLVWTNKPQRVFAAETELAYLRAFANSIMAAVHKLDIEMADRAKTNLVSNISHELRSPLHGILGTADLLSDTALNALQYGMVHTLEACGRTLLDTINHLLDFTYIDKFRKDRNSKHKHAKKAETSSQNHDTLERNPPNSSENINTHVQLDAVLEEVVESIFAGHTFYHHARRNGGSPKTAVVSAKQVTIIFDIQESNGWGFYTQAGCWRRIMLNVFSNALKYTQQGFVYIGLKVGEAETPRGESNDSSQSDSNAKYTVTLTVKDTGQGIGTAFLRNGLFVPFSQEDALAPGSGLGLSIVRKAVASLHGTIELSSEKDKGTEVTIQVPMSPVSDNPDESSTTAAYRSIRKKAQGKTLGLIGFGSSLVSERDSTLSNSLTRLCEDWFHLIVKRINLNDDPPAACDFYLMVHTDLDDPDAKGNQVLDLAEPSKVSPLIVICHCPEAAHKLYARSTSMSHNPKPIVEFISQPCGPRKLAKSMELCLKRMGGQETDQHEETRWVELPESSHLPLDIGPRDAPDERMKVSKRLAEEKNDEQHSRKPINDNISLPDEPGTVPEVTAPDGIAENGPPSVLLVEDNPINLNILDAYTKKEGWSSTTAQNGLEAFERFQEHPGKFALVIIDISMPVMNGFEASQRIRQFERKYFDAHPELRPSWHPTTIVALTGLDSKDAQHEAFASGINVFLTKPISRAKIRTLLKNL